MGEDELDFLRRYTSYVATLLRRIEPGPILAAVSALYAAWKGGKPVLFCGNGGSGASCSHIVNDFARGCGLKAICLSDAVPLVSAWANDDSWSNVFAPQVAMWGEEGGVLVAVSGSGNSANVLRAVAEACAHKVTVVSLTGFDGGTLREVSDIGIHVPTDSMQQAEDVHMVILHMLYLGLKRRIEAGEGHE
jgi:D-sedoheptulose 7-phosphate isomerase